MVLLNWPPPAFAALSGRLLRACRRVLDRAAPVWRSSGADISASWCSATNTRPQPKAANAASTSSSRKVASVAGEPYAPLTGGGFLAQLDDDCDCHSRPQL